MALVSNGVYLRLQDVVPSFGLLHGLVHAALEPLQVGTFTLAFEYERAGIGSGGTQGVAPRFRLAYRGLRGRYLFPFLPPRLFHLGFRPHDPVAVLCLCYTAVQGRNLDLTASEWPVGAEHVVDGRYKVRVAVRAAEIPGEGCQKTYFALPVPCHQYAEHLALLQFLAPIAARGDVPLHFGRCHAAQRVRHVVEWPREEHRQGDAAYILLKPVQHSTNLMNKGTQRHAAAKDFVAWRRASETAPTHT